MSGFAAKKLVVFVCPLIVFVCIILIFGINDGKVVYQPASQPDLVARVQDVLVVNNEDPNVDNIPEVEEVVEEDGLAQLISNLQIGDDQVKKTADSAASDIGDFASAEFSNGDGDGDGHENGTGDITDVAPITTELDHREIFSLSTKNRKYFPLKFGNHIVYNPNILPHPTKHDTWIIAGQHEGSCEKHVDLEEMVCDAIFWEDVLSCITPPTLLPVEPSIQGTCEGDLAVLNLQYGPRDARVFYGPSAPYILYGSQSIFTCISIWLQDVRMLLEDFRLEQLALSKIFERATEVERPMPYKEMEKNFFLFWDSQEQMYAHYDIFPNRVFAQLSANGSIGPDLATAAEFSDKMCMAKYLPTVGPDRESLHQATNSLSITLCKRVDSSCVPNDSNTFIITIFHKKVSKDYHPVYEPYVMLLQRDAPFAIHAISQRPLWISGRGPFTNESGSILWKDQEPPKGHTEMFYMTSMSWKSHVQKYHGHIDDDLFLAFGIEDSKAGAVDLKAGDLLQDLAYCAN
ncbi:uncharacterized protein A1O9_05660 [Exophiala aquamarina CBS 119918]|uniref:EH domain-containing protein n=1 Tax=Exophiala aquamarina CBS 119918 TaxID=1182545 RepID=A0A072PQG5_9EURO|nr:uncharacterized protein A1O9_05660 [Exophiala aquamarina CBS 119918]KEF57740.1 hypothetical protein A1O9_05660 [Exophiala aquamarina CBS 119918]